MNLYEAIYARKSVRSYVFDPIPENVLDEIRAFYKEIHSLFENIDTELEVLDNRRKNIRRMSLFGVSAPYYLAFYSEEAPRYLMNAGFYMQQLSLFLCRIGYGSCFLGATKLKKDLEQKNGKKLVALLAFGKSKGSWTRNPIDANRLSMDQLCVFKEPPGQYIQSLLETARLAPSGMNTQPWRFVVFENKIHIFSKKYMTRRFQELGEIDFGILFANLMITSDELWLDLDLIRLENIALKYFPNNTYILSALVKEG